jgi:outer membrane lipoprotein-sorting protein
MNKAKSNLFFLYAVQSALICLVILCQIAPVFAASGSIEQGNEDAGLQRVLNKMDTIAKTFRSFTAKFTQKKYTAVLKEFDDPETGEFFYSRTKDGLLLIRHEVLSPGKRITTVKGDTGTVYRPAIKEAQIVRREKMQSVVEYLAVGIGQSSEKLREKFKVSYRGSESINNTLCSILILVPKDPKVGLESIEVWLKESSGTPAQYKFQEPSKDYLLISFSNEKLNTKIPASKFEQKLPAGVEIQKY